MEKEITNEISKELNKLGLEIVNMTLKEIQIN